jgi:hypothetical protein
VTGPSAGYIVASSQSDTHACVYRRIAHMFFVRADNPMVLLVQLRSHFEDALRVGKPVILGEFGKLHHGGMKQRRSFLEAVYAEVEAWNAKHGNVAGETLSRHNSRVRMPLKTLVADPARSCPPVDHCFVADYCEVYRRHLPVDAGSRHICRL